MKGILLKITWGLYKKLEDYMKQNEFPSMSYTIRFILNQFFKNQKNAENNK